MRSSRLSTSASERQSGGGGGTIARHPGASRRSRQLPAASTEGRITLNLNRTRVRLWTDPIAVTLTLSVTARWTLRAADIETLDQPLF